MSYLIFAGERFYPSGGGEDFLGAYDTIEQAYNCFYEHNDFILYSCFPWAHIFCTETLSVVFCFTEIQHWD